jgi:pimeloyl-ACP methyl ester carboxylesterase
LALLPARAQIGFVLRRIFHNDAKVTPERVRQYAQFLCLPGSRTALIRVAQQLGNKRGTAEFEQAIQTIDGIPTGIIWGQYDSLIPADNPKDPHRDQADRINRAIHGSLVRRPFLNTGHVPQEEDPDATAELIREFLSGSPPPDWTPAAPVTGGT